MELFIEKIAKKCTKTDIVGLLEGLTIKECEIIPSGRFNSCRISLFEKPPDSVLCEITGNKIYLDRDANVSGNIEEGNDYIIVKIDDDDEPPPPPVLRRTQTIRGPQNFTSNDAYESYLATLSHH